MFLYQVSNGEVRILGSRTYDGIVEIPELIDGRPVTELAPYAFSEGWGRREMLAAAGEILLADSEGNAWKGNADAGLGGEPAQEAEVRGMDVSEPAVLATELPPVACCGHLREIILPAALKKTGNYAFYNCYELETFRCFGGIEDVGSGLFTGCMGIRKLDIHMTYGKRSCFKELITELRQEIDVDYYAPSDNPNPAQSIRVMPQLAKLVFPEMYEEAVENTPARIIMREMHGCGHRYRYCFDGTDFQFRRYDSLFLHVKVQEPERVVVRLALGRLRYPLELYSPYREDYEDYLREHYAGAVRTCLEAGDDESMLWVTEHYADTRKRMDEAVRMAGEFKRNELMGRLMDLRHRRYAAKKRTFSL